MAGYRMRKSRASLNHFTLSIDYVDPTASLQCNAVPRRPNNLELFLAVCWTNETIPRNAPDLCVPISMHPTWSSICGQRSTSSCWFTEKPNLKFVFSFTETSSQTHRWKTFQTFPHGSKSSQTSKPTGFVSAPSLPNRLLANRYIIYLLRVSKN